MSHCNWYYWSLYYWDVCYPDIRKTKQIREERKEKQSDVLHKSDTEDLFQETSSNPIKWVFLDEYSSDSRISGESTQVNLSFSNK